MTEAAFCVVDAFTKEAFRGNPAAVMIFDAFPDDDGMRLLAREHNYAETAFLVRRGAGHYDLRWFTPAVEVPLCGHGTLAAAHALFIGDEKDAQAIKFETKSGPLTVERSHDPFHQYKMSLPLDDPRPIPMNPAVGEALGAEPEALLFGKFLLAVFADENVVRGLRPDMAKLALIEADEVVPTALGKDTDFVSRMFGPRIGIPEDPFTGAVHTALTPYWAERLGKTRLTAHQASERGGDAVCELSGDRVLLFGNAVLTMRGHIVF